MLNYVDIQLKWLSALIQYSITQRSTSNIGVLSIISDSLWWSLRRFPSDINDDQVSCSWKANFSYNIAVDYHCLSFSLSFPWQGNLLIFDDHRFHITTTALKDTEWCQIFFTKVISSANDVVACIIRFMPYIWIHLIICINMQWLYLEKRFCDATNSEN